LLTPNGPVPSEGVRRIHRRNGETCVRSLVPSLLAIRGYGCNLHLDKQLRVHRMARRAFERWHGPAVHNGIRVAAGRVPQPRRA
ncbi:unnamed protein product, partial [Musa hybrid cultivar]